MNYHEFKQKYLPTEIEIDKVENMSHAEFWHWLLKKPEAEQKHIREEMMLRASGYKSKATHLLELLGF